MTVQILRGDALALPLADASVDLVVTSPPYFALRSYTDGGEHYAGQLGSEATPTDFVDALIAATSEMRPKSLIGIPWRYAIRCVDDLGLILRAEVIWSKPNGLPESVTDRVRRSHEQWFHMTKMPRYYSAVDESLGVDHFAAFPMEWPRRIIRGWSPAEVCAACGEGRRPVVTSERVASPAHADGSIMGSRRSTGDIRGWDGLPRFNMAREITGYVCACPTPDAPATPGVVLDPFGGTGTTALVAHALDRHGISVDLSADYCRLARWRTTDPGQLAAAMQVEKPPVEVGGQMGMFDEESA